ncbi:hypothetical protein GKJPGBOP_00087 [Streptomyces paromomycinus]|uniref:Ribbon-helix-helix protein CopG domain-containing protein n=2 Tax=Streptomyces paromomycinus TaxID=92743 RepID=A0A401VTL4_STREY|nr:hypothetical protein GKJPGBOP_00087 [Streptomyces paromomycinus]
MVGSAGSPGSTPPLYALLYGRGMSKPVTIRVPEELHAQLQERAEAEGTTVTALITEAARNAVRDPRLESAADLFRQFVAQNADAFDAAFPDDAPAGLDAADSPGRAA